jgi:very-short-patch-repair endonuclease
MRRDDFVSLQLERTGWKVIRVWESAIQRNVDEVATRIATIVRSRCPNITSDSHAHGRGIEIWG